MNPNDLIPDPLRRNAFSPAEETLRLIASLPAPQGLADRVHVGLRSAPHNGRIVMWRGPLSPGGGWMYSSMLRGAAAAAIVCVVAGGGWRIYSHVHPADSAKVLDLAAPASPAKAFSNAGAKRVPETLQGPVISHPVAPPAELNVVDKTPAERKAGPLVKAMKKKPASRPAAVPVQ